MFESKGAMNGDWSGGVVAGGGRVEQGEGVLVPPRRIAGCMKGISWRRSNKEKNLCGVDPVHRKGIRQDLFLQ